MNKLPKSLHTVRVLAIMAHQASVDFAADGAPLSDKAAIDYALLSLGYSRDIADPDGLRDKALTALAKHRAAIEAATAQLTLVA